MDIEKWVQENRPGQRDKAKDGESTMNQDDKDYTAFLEGDQKGFEALVMRYKDSLIYFIQRFGPGFSDAEDLAQDVFVEILLHQERYRIGQGFKTYLYTIAHHKSVDWVRKHHREVLVEDCPEEADSITVEQHTLAKEQREELRKAIRQLKPEEQRLVFLAELEELSYREIARVMSLTLPQVKIRLYRVRRRLKEILIREGLTI